MKTQEINIQRLESLEDLKLIHKEDIIEINEFEDNSYNYQSHLALIQNLDKNLLNYLIRDHDFEIIREKKADLNGIKIGVAKNGSLDFRECEYNIEEICYDKSNSNYQEKDKLLKNVRL